MSNAAVCQVMPAGRYQIHQKQPIDEKLAVRTLRSLLNHQQQLARSNDGHEVLEVIKALQDSNTIDPNDLFNVEWS